MLLLNELIDQNREGEIITMQDKLTSSLSIREVSLIPTLQ